MTADAEDISFRPFTVLLGIILGSLFAITFCSAIVGFVFWFLADEEPRLAAELEGLIEMVSIFFVLTSFAALSFLGSLRAAGWRYPSMAALWLGLFATGWYYWP